MDIFVKPSVSLVKYLKVLMISVYENNRDIVEEGGNITFWCLHNALTEEHKAGIRKIADMYGQKVEFIYGDVSIFDALPSPAPWPKTIYFGLLAHQYLPESVHRALYLDIDIIVNGSLKEFYNLPFDDNYLIASRDKYDARNEPEQALKDFAYADTLKEADLLAGGAFNCGSVLFNLDKFRQDNIDINFYNNKLRGKTVKFADQSILSYCFYQKTKLLKTCKYNYRIGYSMVNLDESRENFYYSTYLHFKFCPVQARIIHYCGYKGFKPWMVHFTRDEIDINLEFRDICKEYADYVDIWWQYARKSPDFEELWDAQQRNKTAYSMVRLLIRNRSGEFAKRLYLNTVNIPDYFGRAVIRSGDDINRYVKPGVYACDASTKKSVKNLPADFTEPTNFRLTVKALSVGAAYSASLVQELEVADEDASLYRRYTKNRDTRWSPWVKIAAAGALEKFVEKAVSEAVSCNFSKYSDEKIGAVSKDLAGLSAQIKSLRNDLESLKSSKSYKLGRALTYIPRKIRDAFRRKKK